MGESEREREKERERERERERKTERERERDTESERERERARDQAADLSSDFARIRGWYTRPRSSWMQDVRLMDQARVRTDPSNRRGKRVDRLMSFPECVAKGSCLTLGVSG